MSWVSKTPKVRTVPLKDEEIVHHKQIILPRDERAKLDAKTFLTFKRESLSEFPSRFNEVSVTSLSGDEPYSNRNVPYRKPIHSSFQELPVLRSGLLDV